MSPSQPTARSRRPSALRWLAQAALLYGTLCLITLPSGTQAWWVWAVVAVVAATVGDRVLAVGDLAFRPRGRWLLRALRLPVAVLADTWLLARRLVGLTAGESRFEGVAFPTRAEEGDRAVTRRVLAEAAGSVAPNVFVVGVDRDREVLVVHQLVPRDDVAGDADPLRLR